MNKRVQDKGTGKRAPWQFLTKFVVYRSDGSVYFTRWRLIQTPFFSIFLHKFLTGDSDPYVHDHPWSFTSFVLRGGYIEARRNNNNHFLDARQVKHINVMRRDDAHYIMDLLRVPTWTLVITGRRRRTWGFWVPIKTQYNGVQNQRWIEFDNWNDYSEDRLGRARNEQFD